MLGYDYEDRLTSIGVNGNNAVYGYNALDARVSKIAPGQPNRTYLRDGTDAATDVISDGVASMVPGISERDASGTRVLHFDQLGTARLQTDANENVTNQFSSDAFGIPSQVVNPNGSQAAFAAGWNYQSDPESGLQLLGHRYYDSGSGRFITRDPAEDGFNWYSYCYNSPTEWADPTGLLGYWGPGPTGGPPKIPVPFASPGNGWKWNPAPKSGRGGSWGPKHPVRVPNGKGAQPKASWDPASKGGKPHWDVDDGTGARERYDEDGNPVTDEEAHGRPPSQPSAPGGSSVQNFLTRLQRATGLTGAAFVAYVIISEGSRLYPPRDLVPLP